MSKAQDIWKLEDILRSLKTIATSKADIISVADRLKATELAIDVIDILDYSCDEEE